MGEKKGRGAQDTRARFEQWVNNPQCDANVISAVCHVPMREVAKTEANARPNPGLSPFAAGKGVRFESYLFNKDGQKIKEMFVREGLIESGNADFVDFRIKANRGPFANLDDALDAGEQWLSRWHSSSHDRPQIISGLVLRVPGKAMLPETILVVDVILARPHEGKIEFVIGEVKTYPDRGGYTDAGNLATARAQAGIYVHALRSLFRERGFEDRFIVSDTGFLILSRSGFYSFPVLREQEDFKYQAERAKRGFEKLREVASKGEGDPNLGTIESIRSAPTSYSESCHGFCDRLRTCYTKAFDSGDPMVLGKNVADFTNGISLSRVESLVRGSKAVTPEETEFLDRFNEIREMMQEV